MNFSENVYRLTAKIPAGKITTYKALAHALGDVNKARAVGNALNKNKNFKKVPCHRVVKSNGEIGGYAKGVNIKIKKLKAEGIDPASAGQKKILNFNKLLFKF